MGFYSEIKAAGREALAGQWTDAVLFTLVYAVITSILNGINYIIPAVGSLLAIPFLWANQTAYLRQRRQQAGLDIEGLFAGYAKGNFVRVFLTILLMEIFTLLWTLLLIIPGIVKAVSYSQTAYILVDRPELKANEAISLSQQMMKGHKMEYFLLQLSFIGWALLAILSLGIGFLWLIPYVLATNAAFYERVSGALNGSPAEA